MAEENMTAQPVSAPPPEPGVSQQAAVVDPQLVMAASQKLVELGALEAPVSEVTPGLLAVLRFIMEQAGVDVDLGNPEVLTEFLNVIVSGPTAPSGGAPGAPGVGPSGVEPIAPEPPAGTGLNAPGPKRLIGLPGTRGPVY